MRWAAFLVVVLAVLLALAAWISLPKDQWSGPPVPVHYGTIVFLGDSLTEGHGLKKEQAYPALVQIPHMTTLNMGETGDTVAQGLKRLRDYFAGGGQAQLMVIALGANDIFQKIPRVKTEDDLHSVIAECQSRGIPVLLCGVRMPGERMADWTFRWVAWHENVPFKSDVMAGQYFHREHLQSDNTHPDAEGQKLMAASMQATLQRFFAFTP